MKQLIYVVEDDTALQELYTFSLENDFECRCFGDAETFFKYLAVKAPDLVILDIMLPGESGFGVLSRLKNDRQTSAIPVIMVSAKGEEISKVKGLNMGADDYMEKPFGVMELVARIKANLRKVYPAKENVIDNISFKDVYIDFSKHRILIRDNVIQTTLKEFKLLQLLCENAEKVQKREYIFNKIWGESFIGESRTLDIHIKELRKKLAEAESEAVIMTVRGVGYMMT
ncbi:MAG: response regulator transcription factor [Oscillospiraceae bacterium]|nr:response regulator transcription factor [Oscillospiraceae bacterium]